MEQSMIYQCDSNRRFVFKCSWGTSTPFCLKSRSQVLQLRIFSSESLAEELKISSLGSSAYETDPDPDADADAYADADPDPDPGQDLNQIQIMCC